MPQCNAYTYCDSYCHCDSHCHSNSYSNDDAEANAHGKAASNTCASAVIAGINGLFEVGPALVGNTSPRVDKCGVWRRTKLANKAATNQRFLR